MHRLLGRAAYLAILLLKLMDFYQYKDCMVCFLHISLLTLMGHSSQWDLVHMYMYLIHQAIQLDLASRTWLHPDHSSGNGYKTAPFPHPHTAPETAAAA